MSENFDELGELGDKIKKIIDTAVSTKDYRQMTERLSANRSLFRCSRISRNCS